MTTKPQSTTEEVAPCEWCKQPPEVSKRPNQPVASMRCINRACPVSRAGWMAIGDWNGSRFRHYFCSCGGALTAEEYITHYFELGHDRGDSATSAAPVVDEDQQLAQRIRSLVESAFITGHMHGPSADYQVQLKFRTLKESQQCQTLIEALVHPEYRESFIRQGVMEPFPAAATAVPVGNDSLPLLGYERIITIEWDRHNARRHELIEAKRSRLLSESEISELSELQWLAGIKRELQSGPNPAAPVEQKDERPPIDVNRQHDFVPIVGSDSCGLCYLHTNRKGGGSYV